jgi:CheY-like chemotaxis protein
MGVTELPKVILIEDDPALRRVFELFLLDDYVVRTFDRGADAMTALKANPADVVVSDINLPEMDGFELRRRIVSDLNGDTPRFIFLTSYDDSDTITRANKLGVDAFLVKPVNRCDLVSTIERVLATA